MSESQSWDSILQAGTSGMATAEVFWILERTTHEGLWPMASEWLLTRLCQLRSQPWPWEKVLSLTRPHCCCTYILPMYSLCIAGQICQLTRPKRVGLVFWYKTPVTRCLPGHSKHAWEPILHFLFRRGLSRGQNSDKSLIPVAGGEGQRTPSPRTHTCRGLQLPPSALRASGCGPPGLVAAVSSLPRGNDRLRNFINVGRSVAGLISC